MSCLLIQPGNPYAQPRSPPSVRKKDAGPRRVATIRSHGLAIALAPAEAARTSYSVSPTSCLQLICPWCAFRDAPFRPCLRAERGRETHEVPADSVCARLLDVREQ